MDINNIEREIYLSQIKGSAFLFGPRMTGKTSLLKKVPSALYVDLLDPENELTYRADPKLLYKQLEALEKGARVIIDEVQRLPVLLDYVQLGIENFNLNFFLSGSSARKLKRGSANLLGGRAADLKLHPLTSTELGDHFNLDNALQFGTLPKIATFLLKKEISEAKRMLRSYISIYLKEEIQAEALVRNLGAFQRFLTIAAHSNAQMIEYANISRECSVHMSTVKDYFSILEDTLIGNFVWPWNRSERKKARPRFYFFDCGVVRAIQSRLSDKPTPHELGFLFETFFINEIIAIRDYLEKDHEICMWRQDKNEVDLLILKGGIPLVAFELKYGIQIDKPHALHVFQKEFPKTPLYVVSATAKAEMKDKGFDILPWKKALKLYTDL